MTGKEAQDPSRKLRFRLRLTGGLLLALLLAVALRAIHLQAFDGERLARLGERQHLQERIFVPKRGTILSRNGDSLAISVESQSVYVRPRRLKSSKKAVPALARALDMKPREVRRRVTSEKPFVWLKRQVTPREVQRVKALKIEGIGLSDEPKRYYPQGHLAGQALGLVGRDARGLEGVERSYDRYIRGRARSSVVERDALGRRVLVTGLDDLNIAPGSDVHLTLDTTLQHLAEKHLEATVKRFRAKGGTVVMVDPFTGGILALASYPFFNPNQFRRQDRDRWRIRAITDIYEPGSVFKAVLAAAALEDGVVGREDLIFCEFGRYRYGGRTIHDFKEYGWLSFAKVLQLSSNIGVTKVAHKLGKERYHRYMRRFGFGDKTGIDLPGEVVGTVRPPSRWRRSTATSPSDGRARTRCSGHGFSCRRNGGLLMRRLVGLVGKKGRGLREPPRGARVVSRAGRAVAGILKGVVAEGGTGTRAALTGFEAAGKTGTSQKPEEGGYSKTKRIASFVGFVPADEPRFVLLTLVDEPTVNVYGGVVAAPLFRRIAAPALHALGATPNPRLLPEVQSGRNGGVIRVSRRAARHRKSTGKNGQPDLVGLSMREAVDRAKRLKTSVVLRGHGYVVDQRVDSASGRLVLTLKD